MLWRGEFGRDLDHNWVRLSQIDQGEQKSAKISSNLSPWGTKQRRQACGIFSLTFLSLNMRQDDRFC